MLESYLRDLEARSGRGLPANEVSSLVAEVREHLEESIRARIELGTEPEDAEREAIAAFGAAPRVARDVVQTSRAPRMAAKVRLLAAAYALFIVALVAGPAVQRWSETAYHGIFVLGWLTVALFAFASFRSRRPAPVRIVSTGLAAAVVLWSALGATWLNLYPYDGLGMMPRWEVRRELEASKDESAVSRDQEALAVTKAKADPLGNLLSFVPEALTVGSVAAAVGSGIDLAFGGLGALVFVLRRKRGGGLHA